MRFRHVRYSKAFPTSPNMILFRSEICTSESYKHLNLKNRNYSMVFPDKDKMLTPITSKTYPKVKKRSHNAFLSNPKEHGFGGQWGGIGHVNDPKVDL